MRTERRSVDQPLGWVRDMHRGKQLDLDPPYQRRSVWSRDYKQFFIDTIIRNYPIPPIFVSVEVRDDGSSVYHVVDGKQRLSSILEFLGDEFPLSRKDYSPPALAGKYFSELDSATQRSFYSYYIPFEYFTEITDEEVVRIFERYNRNVAQLNAQELRHAKFSGAFINQMENLADEPFWQGLAFFGIADIRRMRDVEYVSVIFALTMHGIEDGDSLDEYYANYDEQIPDVGEHLERYHIVQGMASRMQEAIRKTRLKNRNDFYSLWSALLEFADEPDTIDYGQTVEQLVDFAVGVDAVPTAEDPSTVDDDAQRYSQSVRAGTTKLPNREIRKRILLTKIVRK